MATRAEWFRYAAERRHASPRPAAKAPPASPAPPRESARARAASYALEESATRPSRKSTRGSANHQKTDTQFRMKQRNSEGRAREP